MLRNVSHVPEAFEVTHTDLDGHVLGSWVINDALDVMALIDVEPGSIDYADALELMVEGYRDVIGPARAGGVIHVEPVGRIDVAPPNDVIVEVEHYANGNSGVNVDGAVWPDRDAVDVVAAWTHYVDNLTDDERRWLRARARKEWGWDQ